MKPHPVYRTVRLLECYHLKTGKFIDFTSNFVTCIHRGTAMLKARTKTRIILYITLVC